LNDIVLACQPLLVIYSFIKILLMGAIVFSFAINIHLRTSLAKKSVGNILQDFFPNTQKV